MTGTTDRPRRNAHTPALTAETALHPHNAGRRIYSNNEHQAYPALKSPMADVQTPEPAVSGLLEFGHFALTRMCNYVSLHTVKHRDVIRRRDRLAANLPTAELLRGSLLQRTVRHKTGCPKCERGEGHPVLVLAVSEPGGKVRHISLRPEQKPMVQDWIENYHRLKNQIEEVCQLNQTLLRPEP
jgi:hypothetical protein